MDIFGEVSGCVEPSYWTMTLKHSSAILYNWLRACKPKMQGHHLNKELLNRTRFPPSKKRKTSRWKGQTSHLVFSLPKSGPAKQEKVHEQKIQRNMHAKYLNIWKKEALRYRTIVRVYIYIYVCHVFIYIYTCIHTYKYIYTYNINPLFIKPIQIIFSGKHQTSKMLRDGWRVRIPSWRRRFWLGWSWLAGVLPMEAVDGEEKSGENNELRER